MNSVAVVMAGCDVVKILYSGKEVEQACKVIHCWSRTQKIFQNSPIPTLPCKSYEQFFCPL